MTCLPWELYARGELGEAVAAADAALDAADAGRHLHFSGLAMVAMGDCQRGIARLQAAVELYPETDGYVRNASIACGERLLWAPAAHFANIGCLRFPTDWTFPFLRASAWHELGHVDAAEPDFRRAVALHPLTGGIIPMAAQTRPANEPS